MKQKIDKKQILLDSFDALKDNWDDNYEEIKKIIVTFFKEDVNVGLEMWDYISNHHNNSDLTLYSKTFSKILEDYTKIVSFSKKSIKDFRKYNAIIESVFIESNSIIYFRSIYVNFLKELITNHLYDDLMFFLDALFKNNTIQHMNMFDDNIIKKLSQESNSSFIIVLLFLFDSIDCSIPEKAQDILYLYIERITNKEYRAKLNAAFISKCLS